MLKRIILFFLGFVVLASLAYYGFSHWRANREKVNLWNLVPENAAFVIETNNHSALVAHLQETEIWTSVSGLPFARRFEENFAWLDSISPGNQRLERFFDKKHVLTSVHVTDSSELDFVFYVPVNTVGEHRFLRTLTENVNKNTVFQEESREFQGVLLTDVSNTSTGSSFTYFSYHNNIILSASPALIEEIVLHISSGKTTSIKAAFGKTNYLNQPDVYANIFINYRAVPDVLALFLDKSIMPEVRYLAGLCKSGLLELKLEQDRIFLNGFSISEKLRDSFHSTIAPEKPYPFEIKNVVPLRTAMLLHFGLNEITRLQREPLDTSTTKPAYAAAVESLSKSFGHELALAYMETFNISNGPEKIVIAKLRSKALGKMALRQLKDQVSKARNKKIYTENYSNYEISLLEIPELPAQLFGKLFEGFEQSYIVQVDDYLFFSEDMEALRSMLDDIVAESVWGKSTAQKAFLEETLQEGNFSLFINTVNAWYVLNRYTKEESRENLLQAARFIRRFNQVSFQFAKDDTQYYTSFLLRKQERTSGPQIGSFNLEQELTFNNRLVTQPLPIQNAVDKSWEVVVQDSAHVLHNMSAAGKRGWVDTLGTAIKGKVQQFTTGPESKLRYAFASASRIHAISNYGQSLDNFPFNVGDSLNLQRLSVFDYEKDGNFNLLVDDRQGNLYMFDVRGSSVAGWQPRRMDYGLAAAPQHLRISGSDVIVVPLENGYIYALNRAGDTFRGFPVSLRSPLTSDVFIKPGPDLRRTEVTAVTRYGEVVVLNLQGRTLKREQLLRPSKSALFELVTGSSGKSFIVVRQEQGRVAIFDQDLKEQFEKRYVTSAPKHVQFFNFGGGKKIYAITETGPQKTYLYNATGSLIGGKALDSSQQVTIYYNETENSYSLYKVYRNQLQRLSFKVSQ